ncbi:NAD(P)-dependent oxidoreductase [Actinokineospora sp. UTMC 2448]|uniref:NAD-dependent epimerase/dehydratase family protein n=1 Tax=Actinokineospora sp. UTMC 2448 TaxID=2268449 RepID=UPI002164C07C|nr:NAD(P)-dependent oxidoreductase [Actinokineospora sp. UTMC 2448]UVS78926.1 UDP-glucose 4-epimerase [Actinokineospora sp. UTMC 2448]
MTALVTGGAGVLGRAVVRALADAGHHVVSVDLPGTAGPDGADAIAADLTGTERARSVLAEVGPAVVVHLAAIAVPFSRPETELLRTNLSLAHNVCEAAVAVGAGSVVLASSPTVMGYGRPGWRPRYLPLDEDHPVAPWHAYALSKVATEQLAAMYARRGERTRFAVVRPGYVISPEQWAGAPTQDGSTIGERLADPAIAARSLFNYVDARDAADLVVRLGDADVPSGEVFFACAADPLARAPLADLLPRDYPAPPAGPAFSIDKAARLLGWQPARSWRTEFAGGPR